MVNLYSSVPRGKIDILMFMYESVPDLAFLCSNKFIILSATYVPDPSFTDLQQMLALFNSRKQRCVM